MAPTVLPQFSEDMPERRVVFQNLANLFPFKAQLLDIGSGFSPFWTPSFEGCWTLSLIPMPLGDEPPLFHTAGPLAPMMGSSPFFSSFSTAQR